MDVTGNSEVLVVGAGPAGAAAGIMLARAGVDVCVVDRAVFPRDKTCGDALSNDGVELLYELGAGRLMEAAPHALVRRAAAVFPDGSRVSREYARPGYIIPRYHLDDCLRRALEKSGARLIQDQRVTRLLKDDRDKVVGAVGNGFNWTSKVVIAADGYGSVGLEATGATKPDGRCLGVSSTAYYRDITFPFGEDTSDHFFDAEIPFGYGWIFPAAGGVSNIGVYLRADAYQRMGLNLKNLLAGFLERHADRFRNATQVGKTRTWSLPLAPRPIKLHAPGLFLAGDAASFIDPLSGEGIWQALHTGMLAGSAVANVIRHGEERPDVIAAYEHACKHDILRPSRAKLWVQEGIDTMVNRKLYRIAPLRKALDWGYRSGLLEMTKS